MPSKGRAVPACAVRNRFDSKPIVIVDLRASCAVQHAWGVASILLVSSVVSLENRLALFRSRVLPFVGDASPSIMVWSILSVVVATGTLLRLGLEGTALHVGVALASFVLTLLAYLSLEKPLNRFFTRGRAHGRNPVSAAGTAG